MITMYILLLLAIVFLLYNFLKTRRVLKLPPIYPDRYPLIESTHMIFADTKQMFQVYQKIGKFSIENGGAAHGYFGPHHIFALTEPEACLEVINKCSKGWPYDFARPWIGEGLVSTNDLKQWKLHRKLANTAFKLPMLESYLGIYNEQIKRVIEIFDKKVGKGPFEHGDVLEDFTLETMYQTTMGFDENDTSNVFEKQKTAMRTIMKIIALRVATIWWHSHFLFNFSSLKRKQDEVLEYLHRNSDEVIKNKRDLRAINKSKGLMPTNHSFLDVFLDGAEKHDLKDQEIREEVATLMVAGSETTSSMLIFTLMLLGSHPDVQEKVYEELQEVFEGSTRDIEKQDLPKLVLLEGVIMETTRLYPVMPFLPRHANEDITLKNYTIPAGSEPVIFTYHLHRNQSFWGSDANDFRPERWSTPGGVPSHPGAFFGFSVGKRSCIGKTQAIITMKVTLAHLLRRYRVSADLNKLELQLDTLLKPASGCEISLEAR